MNDLTWLLTHYPMLEGEGGGGGSAGGGGNDPKLPTNAEELRTLLNSESAATRRAVEKDRDKAIEDAVKAALDKAKADADAATKLAKDEEAGNFTSIREGLEKERDEAKTLAAAKEAEATEKAAKLEKANKLLEGRLADRVKALDHEDLKDVKAAYLAKFPDDTADLLDRLDYLDDPRTVAALAKVTDQTDQHRTNLRGAGGTVPNANGEFTQNEIKSLVTKQQAGYG